MHDITLPPVGKLTSAGALLLRPGDKVHHSIIGASGSFDRLLDSLGSGIYWTNDTTGLQCAASTGMMEFVERPVEASPVTPPGAKDHIPISGAVEQAFYAQVEVTRVGSIRWLDEGLNAAISMVADQRRDLIADYVRYAVARASSETPDVAGRAELVETVVDGILRHAIGGRVDAG